MRVVVEFLKKIVHLRFITRIMGFCEAIEHYRLFVLWLNPKSRQSQLVTKEQNLCVAVLITLINIYSQICPVLTWPNRIQRTAALCTYYCSTINSTCEITFVVYIAWADIAIWRRITLQWIYFFSHIGITKFTFNKKVICYTCYKCYTITWKWKLNKNKN